METAAAMENSAADDPFEGIDYEKEMAFQLWHKECERQEAEMSKPLKIIEKFEQALAALDEEECGMPTFWHDSSSDDESIKNRGGDEVLEDGQTMQRPFTHRQSIWERRRETVLQTDSILDAELEKRDLPPMSAPSASNSDQLRALKVRTLTEHSRVRDLKLGVLSQLVGTEVLDPDDYGEDTARAGGKLGAMLNNIANVPESHRDASCAICSFKVAFPFPFRCRCRQPFHWECVAGMVKLECPLCRKSEIDEEVADAGLCDLSLKQVRKELELEGCGLASLLDSLPCQIWSVVAGRVYVFELIQGVEHDYKNVWRGESSLLGLREKVVLVFTDWGAKEVEILNLYRVAQCQKGGVPKGRITVRLE